MAETPAKTTSQAGEFKGISQQTPKMGAAAKPPRPLKMFMAKKESKRMANNG